MTINELIKRLEEIRDEHGGELPIKIEVDGRYCEIHDLSRFASVCLWPDEELVLEIGQ